MTHKPKTRGNSIYKDAMGQWWAQITLDNGKLKRIRATSQQDGVTKLKRYTASK